MRVPKVLKVLSLTHWDQLEISAADGRTVFLESDREWYVERADRILGFASDSSELLEIDIAQIVAIPTHEAHRQPLDPAPATFDHERPEGEQDGTSPEITRIHAHFKQDWRRGFRPIRVRFRAKHGVQCYELTEVGQGIFMPYLGKFILVPPGVPRADFYMDDFIEVGFIDELDARDRQREAS